MRILLAFALTAGCAVQAAPLEPTRSAIEFTGTQMGVPVKGRFTVFAGEVRFDPADLAASQARVTVEAASIDIGVDEGNEALRGPEWFDAGLHPRIEFTGRRFQAVGGGRYELLGELALKGVRRSLRLPLTVSRGADGYWLAETRFELRRLDFGLGTGDWADTSAVADAVQVRVRLAARAE